MTRTASVLFFLALLGWGLSRALKQREAARRAERRERSGPTRSGTARTEDLGKHFDAMEQASDVLAWLQARRPVFWAEWPRGGGLDQALAAARRSRHGPALDEALQALEREWAQGGLSGPQAAAAAWSLRWVSPGEVRAGPGDFSDFALVYTEAGVDWVFMARTQPPPLGGHVLQLGATWAEWRSRDPQAAARVRQRLQDAVDRGAPYGSGPLRLQD
jgi:hypothetical protein